MKRTLATLLFLSLISAASYSQNATSKEDSIHCTVLTLVQTDLLTKVRSEEKSKKCFDSKYSIVVLPFDEDNPKIYFLNGNYDFDLYSLQKGDTICMYFKNFNGKQNKEVISFTNLSFLKRTRIYKCDFIDIDFWEVEKRINKPPVFDDGLFLKWTVAKKRFMKYIIEDSEGFHRLEIEDESKLFLSKRLFFQLYSIYVSGHNETLRNRKEYQN